MPGGACWSGPRPPQKRLPMRRWTTGCWAVVVTLVFFLARTRTSTNSVTPVPCLCSRAHFSDSKVGTLTPTLRPRFPTGYNLVPYHIQHPTFWLIQLPAVPRARRGGWVVQFRPCKERSKRRSARISTGLVVIFSYLNVSCLHQLSQYQYYVYMAPAHDAQRFCSSRPDPTHPARWGGGEAPLLLYLVRRVDDTLQHKRRSARHHSAQGAL